MTLREKQSLFVRLFADLVNYATEELGYELTFGEAYRTPEQAEYNARKGTGIANSLHTDRLAIDINLFIDGKYCTSSEDHLALGVYWKNLHPMCRWGGDFDDGGHYSLTHGGRA